MRPLSYQQRLFVEYYLGESAGSAIDAARRAGYRWPAKLGSRLLAKSEVRAAIDARVATAAMTANEVLARVAEVASSDLLDFLEVDPNGGCKVDMKLVKRLGLGHLVKRLRINKDGTQDIVLEARLPALVKLGEHYNLWKREAQQQLTLVNVAKHLRARYEELRRAGECGEPLEDLQGQTEPVQ
jgi:NADH pyrophosphatase NudC (nudix superfamily)